MCGVELPAVEAVLHALGPPVLGVIARRFGDFAAAEDAVQEALLAAATQWPEKGLPESPRGWLLQVASRRMADQVRSAAARRRREAEIARPEQTESEWTISEGETAEEQGDDTLTLLFMCCHPALTSSSAIALTLRAVGGLTTAEIASAFLVPEATMAQRISRAKERIRDSRVPFQLPTEAERPERLRSVLHVLYLIFNEGHTSSVGANLHRDELSLEAIRLTRGVLALLPDECEVAGLLALLLLTDARRPARSGPAGELIPLDRQDRRLWNQRLISEGIDLLSRTLSRGAIGPYQLQAAITAVHDEAATTAETDWPQIVALYRLLMRMSDNPMVRLSHAIAVAMVDGPGKGLELLAAVGADPRLAGHYRLEAVRAHLCELAGDDSSAITYYQAAARRTTSLPERDYLNTKAARLQSGTVGERHDVTPPAGDARTGDAGK